MGYSMRGRARPFSVILALLVVMLSLGTGGYAWADLGSANTAPGQVKQADSSPGNAYAYGQADGTTNGAPG